MIPEYMKAAVLAEPGRFDIRDIPVPACGPRDVLIKVKRVGICGSDIHIFRGHMSADIIPFVPGHEFTGVVATVGTEARTLKVGDRVVADVNIGCGDCFYCRKNEVFLCDEIRQIGIHRNGGFAEYVLVPERLTLRIPDDMPFEIAALVEPLSCCVRSFDRNAIHAGQSVLILGAGPIGNLHVQMARLSGAAPIIAVDLNPKRLEAAKAAGADVVISDPAAVGDIVRQHTDGRGADVVIESVGNARLYEQAFEFARPGGHVAAFGVANQDARSSLKPSDFVLRELSMKGTVASSGDDFHTALTLLRYNRIKTDLFTKVTRSLDGIQGAMEEFMTNQDILKIQIDLDA